MDKKIVDALHARAMAIGAHVARHADNHGNDWGGYNMEPLQIDIPKPGVITFRRNRYAVITFSGVCPHKITKEILHKPVVLNSEVIDSHGTTIVNETSVDQVRTYSVGITETKTFEQEVGVSVTIGIKASIGTPEAAPVQAEVELSTEVETSYNNRFGGSEEIARSTETAVTVPAGKKVTVTTSRSTSTLEQRTEYWCSLEHSVEIHSDKDFHHKWSSMGELKEVLTGKASNQSALGAKYRGKPLGEPYCSRICDPVTVYYDRTLRFQNATTGHVGITEEDL